MKPQIVLVISGEEGAGKTALLGRLATILTLEGHDVTCNDAGELTVPDKENRFVERRWIHLETNLS